MEVRQELWDAQLIEGWLLSGHMYDVANYYLCGVGSDEAQGSVESKLRLLSKVKRAPRTSHEFFRPVRAFMADALPTTSKWLWAGARGPRVMRVIADEQRVTAEAVAKKERATHKRRPSLPSLRKKLQAATLSQKATRQLYDRSDWTQIKGAGRSRSKVK